MTTTTVMGRATVTSGAGKVTQVKVTTQPPYGFYSLHDCVDPGQVQSWNCIWPQGLTGIGDGKTFTQGLVVHTREPGGVFAVDHI